MSTMPSRMFNQDSNSAKRSADSEDLLARLSMGDEDADDIDVDPAPASLRLKVSEL